MKVIRESWAVAHAAAALFVALGLLVIDAGPADAQQPPVESEWDPVVVGAFDIHVHGDPDSFGPYSNQQARRVDAIEIARLAREAGVRGFLMKQHYDQTASMAYLVRKAVPGVEVFGVLGLNRPMGGINVAAVQHFAEIKGGWGRLVFMPTWDAAHFVRGRKLDRPYVTVSRNGELLPEVKEVIAEIARTRTRDSDGPLVMATGHNSPEESLMMLREGRRVGLRHMVVTHPLLSFVGMSIEQMQEAARLGAYLEFVSHFTRSDEETRVYVEAIRQVGVEHCIVSSDVGQVNNPLHPDALSGAAKALRAHGFTDRELEIMFQENPARLLGLPLAGETSTTSGE